MDIQIIPNFYPPMANQVRQGILTSLRQILEKRVLPSLSPLLTNPKLDKELQLLIHESFPEFCRTAHNSSPPNVDGIKDFIKELDGVESGIMMQVSSSSESAVLSANHQGSAATTTTPSLIPADPNDPVFSDDEDQDDIPIGTSLTINLEFLSCQVI